MNDKFLYKSFEVVEKFIVLDKLNKIIKLRDFLYNNASIFLSRKKEKIDHYIEYRANVLNNINTQCNA